MSIRKTARSPDCSNKIVFHDFMKRGYAANIINYDATVE